MGKRPNVAAFSHMKVSQAPAVLIALVLCPGSSGQEHQFECVRACMHTQIQPSPFKHSISVSAQETECRPALRLSLKMAVMFVLMRHRFYSLFSNA